MSPELPIPRRKVVEHPELYNLPNFTTLGIPLKNISLSLPPDFAKPKPKTQGF